MLLTAVTTATAQKEPIRIDLSKKGAVVSPNLYGIFFEEISHAGDGGLYAELVQNRGFEEHVLPSGMTYREDIRKSRLSTPLAIQTACWSRFPATIWLTHTGIAALISSLPITTSSMMPPEPMVSMSVRVRAKRGGGAYLTSSNLTRSYPFICTTMGCSWVP